MNLLTAVPTDPYDAYWREYLEYLIEQRSSCRIYPILKGEEDEVNELRNVLYAEFVSHVRDWLPKE